jgi:F-box and WD-40 domain protein 1/11
LISILFYSVYCLEFDSRRIITGSRDRTIKVWSLRTGALLATFVGVHLGSVLCLKFEGDWDREWIVDDGDPNGDGGGYSHWEDDGESAGRFGHRDDLARGRRRRRRKGFMVSGSSDCSVCVWDLDLGPIVEYNDTDVNAYSDSQMHVDDDGERQVTAEVRAILKGHSGGVLDLRIDEHWIVSWCVIFFFRFRYFPPF